MFNAYQKLKKLINNQKAVSATFPELLNNWVSYNSAGDNTINKVDGIVFLKLSLKSGTSKDICQLPEGFRPALFSYYPITNLDNHAAGVFGISSGGWITVENSEVGKAIFANVSFKAKDWFFVRIKIYKKERNDNMNKSKNLDALREREREP